MDSQICVETRSHLGSHVGWCAFKGSVVAFGMVIILEGVLNRYPPVHHDHLTKLSYHHVFGFDIAVQISLCVSKRDGVANLQ